MEESTHRIGIITSLLGKKETDALRFAILHLNTLQDVVEFQVFYDDPIQREFLGSLNLSHSIDRCQFKLSFKKFFIDFEQQLINNRFSKGFFECHRYLAIMDISFTDNYYLTTTGSKCNVLAIKNWSRHMAPPSLLEYIVHQALRHAILAVAGRMPSHFSSSGCIFDFSHSLRNTKNAALIGHLCNSCRGRLDDTKVQSIEKLISLMGGKWLGDPNDPRSAHSTLIRLDFEPFQTSGLKESNWEKIMHSFSTNFFGEAARIFVLVLIFSFAILLGYTEFIETLR